MVFVVVQIRARCRVLKPWYGCVVADQGTRIDLYHKYSSGQLDNSEAISSDYATAMVNCALGSSKHELIRLRVSADVAVGEAVSSLGQYVDFNVEVQEAACSYDVRHH